MTNPIEDLPMGLSMALAQNQDALTKFANMTNTQKQSVIDATHKVNSKQEMRNLVNEL